MEDYNNKGSNKTTVTFIALVAFIIIGAVIVMNKDMLTGNKELEKETEIEEKDTTKLDDKTRNQIKDKLATLMFSMNNKYTDGVHGGYGFHAVLFKRELTHQERQAYVLNATTFEPLTLDYKKIPEIEKMITKDPNSKTEFKQVSTKVVDENFNNLFGEALVDRATEIGNCPPIHYYKDIETYVSFPARCGGATDQFFITYLDGMSKEGDTIEVYMYLGNGKGETVYADYDLASQEEAVKEENSNAIVPKKEVKVEEKDANGRPIINSKNKKDFSKYVFTFNSNDKGEFYFVSVEPVKEEE